MAYRSSASENQSSTAQRTAATHGMAINIAYQSSNASGAATLNIWRILRARNA